MFSTSPCWEERPARAFAIEDKLMTSCAKPSVATRCRIVTAVLAFLQIAWTNDAARSQQASPDAGEASCGSLAGRVVDRRTGAFLADAAVSLFRQPRMARGENRWDLGVPRKTEFSSRSRDDGSFEFDRIPPGDYAVEVELAGYLKSGAGVWPRVVTVPRGGRGRSLTVALHPEAIIQGRVLDGDGRGAAGVAVRAFSRFRRRLHGVASGRTGARGEFVIGQLAPGRYVLRAEPRAEAAAGAPAYHPSARALDGSVPIEVFPGDCIEDIRIALLPEPVYRVRGTADSLRAGSAEGGATVYLVPRSARGVDLAALARETPVEAGTGFEFVGVPSGAYTLRLVSRESGRRILATRAVTVGSSDVVGFGLHAAPPVALPGRITLNGHARSDLSAVRVSLIGVPTVAGPAASRDVLVGSDGRFLARDLEPAAYVLRVQAPPGLYVERVSLGGREVTGSILDLSAGPRGGLEIAFRDGAARLAGAVLGGSATDAGDTAKARFAILLPTGPGAGFAERRVAAVTGERFDFRNVPPGGYRAFVTEIFDPDLFREPAFLAHIAGSVESVSVQAYDRKRLDLRLIDARRVESAARRAGLVEF